MSEWKEVSESDVIGRCSSSECGNEFTKEDEYLKDDCNYYCDSICYTRYMINCGGVKEVK